MGQRRLQCRLPVNRQPRIVSARQNAHSDAAVEAAIARVLAAERAARDALAQARVDAAAITDAARERARAFGERTERRMQRVRNAYDAATEAGLADIAADAARIEESERQTSADRMKLVAAVGALAALLTGELK